MIGSILLKWASVSCTANFSVGCFDIAGRPFFFSWSGPPFYRRALLATAAVFGGKVKEAESWSLLVKSIEFYGLASTLAAGLGGKVTTSNLSGFSTPSRVPFSPTGYRTLVQGGKDAHRQSLRDPRPCPQPASVKA